MEGDSLQDAEWHGSRTWVRQLIQLFVMNPTEYSPTKASFESTQNEKHIHRAWLWPPVECEQSVHT
jgi:hypothetical protein